MPRWANTIKVVFRNACRFRASVHPHGVLYAKDSEGAPYDDGTSGADKADDGVPTGGRHTYTWLVPDRAGPGPHDGTSVMWIVPLAHRRDRRHVRRTDGVDRRHGAGMARADGTPRDVDHEVFALFSVMNENRSLTCTRTRRGSATRRIRRMTTTSSASRT